MIYNTFKVSLILFLSFFLFSCDKVSPDDDEVGSGIAQLKRTLFSKRCQDGSFTVSQSTSLQLSADPFGHLQQGDRVHISGTMNGSHCYNGGGQVSFNCEASVIVGPNRTFVCDSGTVFGGTAMSPTGYPGSINSPGSISPPGSTFTNPNIGVTPRTFVAGEFHVYDNGTKAFGSIILSSSSSLVPQATCRIGFQC